MDNPAKMATREPLARMPARTRNCCPSRPNANAWPNPAQLAPLAPRAPMDHPEMLVVLAEMDNPALKVPLAHPDLLAPTATLALLAHLALLVL